MRINVHYKQCGEGPEIAEHMFFQCERAKMIWKLAHVSWDGFILQTRSFKEWWTEHGKAIDNEKMQTRQDLTTYILWHIWKDRNAWIFNAEKISKFEVV